MHERHWGAGHGHVFGGRGGWHPHRPQRPEWGDMFGRFMGGPPPRAERGNVRYLVLDAIADQPRHGYEIIQHIEKRSGGSYRPSPGVIYPTLQMLEELDHARVEEREGKKAYSITAEGKKDLASHAEDVSDFYERSSESSWDDYADELHDVTRRVGRMFKLIGKAARRGRLTPKTVRKLRDLLDQTLEQIEQLVSEERA